MRHCIRPQSSAAVSRGRHTQMKREICPNDPFRVNHSVPFKSNLHRLKKRPILHAKFDALRELVLFYVLGCVGHGRFNNHDYGGYRIEWATRTRDPTEKSYRLIGVRTKT